jgi:NAD(P)-dependent dehydrogenase (short-subunit alcohol dehydrogenase family)
MARAAFIIGGTGQIGRAAAAGLLRRGWRVTLAHTGRQAPDPMPAAAALGYTPAASYADSIRPYVAWLRRHADDWQTAFPVFKSYPSDPFDYAAENAAA